MRSSIWLGIHTINQESMVLAEVVRCYHRWETLLIQKFFKKFSSCNISWPKFSMWLIMRMLCPKTMMCANVARQNPWATRAPVISSFHIIFKCEYLEIRMAFLAEICDFLRVDLRTRLDCSGDPYLCCWWFKFSEHIFRVFLILYIYIVAIGVSLEFFFLTIII